MSEYDDSRDGPWLALSPLPMPRPGETIVVVHGGLSQVLYAHSDGCWHSLTSPGFVLKAAARAYHWCWVQTEATHDH